MGTDELEINPIDYPLVEGVEPSRYKCFKYKTKKPGNIVSEYIHHYTRKGDIVLDPFCGSGVIAFEALRIGRKAVVIDINPVATFITKSLIKPANLEKYKQAYNRIEKRVKNKIMSLYSTKCRRCGETTTIICTSRNRDSLTPEQELIDVRYYCRRCKKKRIDSPSPSDIQSIKTIRERISDGDISWYPKAKLWYPNGKRFKKAEKIDFIPNLFTERNLLSLTILNEEIGKIKDEDTKDLMRFTFMTLIHLASKLCPVRKTRPFSSHWGRDTSYWVPPKYMEQNVWILFERAYKGKQGVLKAKEETNREITYFKLAENFADFEKDANILIKTASVFDLDEIVPNGKIDYVFTDPPYGGAIQHGELSTMWASWLGFEMNFDEELTINEQQGKDFEYYHSMMYAAFRKIFDAMKADAFMTVTFHNTSTRVFNSAIKAPRYAGFDLVASPIYQVGRRTSVKALAQPFGSAEGDYYLNFKRPVLVKEIKELNLSAERQRRIIIDAAKRIIGRRGEPTSFTDLLRGIHRELSDYGYYPITEEEARDVVRKQSGEEFVPIEVKDEEGKVIGSLWWFKDPSSVKYLEKIPLDERVEHSVLKILKQEFKVTFGEVLQEIFRTYTNALTPNPPSIRGILGEYAKRLKNGKWSLKPTVKAREKEHNNMIGLLAELGKKAGFKAWIGLEEQKKGYYKRKPLSTLSEAKLDVVTDPISYENIQQIDVVWLKNGEVPYLFEVEHTTQITSAILRASYIPPNSTKRFMVIPEERETLMYRRVNAPILKDRIEEYNWVFIFYKDLETFYEMNKGKKRIDIDEFEGLGKKLFPPEEKQKQLSITQFK